MIYKFQISHKDESNDERVVKTWFATERFNTFGEVESFAMQYFGELCFKDLDVISIKRMKASEIINDRSDTEELVWEAELCQYFFIDESTKPKKLKYKVLLYAKTMDDAKQYLTEYLKQGYDDFHLIGLKVTNIENIL